MPIKSHYNLFIKEKGVKNYKKNDKTHKVTPVYYLMWLKISEFKE